MKNIPLTRAACALLAVSGSVLATAHAALIADSHIESVTVYSDRAVVNRTAVIELPAGISEVIFEKLPAALLVDSLQVGGRGNLAATILDVTPRSRYLEFTPNERVRTLEEKLADFARAERVLADRAKGLSAQEATLVRIEAAATQPPSKDAPRLSLEEAGKLLAFVGEERAKLAEQEQDVDRQRSELAAAKNATEKQLADLRGAGGKSFHDVAIRLSAESGGKLVVSLRYAVPGARWSPQYDARVKTDATSVQINYLGVVQQNTGEDWTDVQLTLSTAHPSLGGGPGKLGPWWLDPYRREAMNFRDEEKSASAVGGLKEKAAGKALRSAEIGTSNAAAPMSAPALELQSAQADLAVLATSATFRVPTPATVLSDNSPQKVPVNTLRLPATFEYRTTPKAIAAAFLYAKLENKSEFPLLAGRMNVFLDDTFVASSSLATVMGGEKFELALGADEAIAVKRQVNKQFAEETGLLTKGSRVTYDFTLSVQNHKAHTATIVVTDQIPVARDEKIVVKQLSPGIAELKPAPDGILQWTLTLAPNEKKDLPLRFSIEHPADVTVVGMN